MKIFTNLLKSTLFIAITLITGCGSPDPMLLFNKAVDAANEKDWSTAAVLASESYELHKGKINGTFLAICLQKGEKTTEAQVVLKELAEKHSDDPIVNYLYGKLLFDQNEHAMANKQLIKTYDTNGKSLLPEEESMDCWAMMIHSSIVLNSSQIGRNIESLGSISKYSSDINMLNNVGYWYFNQNDMRKAYISFKKAEIAARRKKAIFPAVLLNIAITRDHERKYQQAHDYYQRYIDALKSKGHDNFHAVSKRISQLKKHLGL